MIKWWISGLVALDYNSIVSRLRNSRTAPAMFELVVVAIGLFAIFTLVVPLTSLFLCAASKMSAVEQTPLQPVLPRYKPGHIPNFGDGLDLFDDDTMYEMKTEIAFPDKETGISSTTSKLDSKGVSSKLENKDSKGVSRSGSDKGPQRK
ncbi:hypothetical protein QR680_018653 [Steinernema hermaphroditum]|uniref:Uncharacterized protein n=1 Tax=Steinernema hermaphroditum TaxID=289476 RepID=A0AA39LRC7_9BILA|nr:hypothetical protein QR680_018653 [Steinernema hermaphroditum]